MKMIQEGEGNRCCWKYRRIMAEVKTLGRQEGRGSRIIKIMSHICNLKFFSSHIKGIKENN